MTTKPRTPAKRTTPRPSRPPAAAQNGDAEPPAAAGPAVPDAPKSPAQREAEGVETVEIQWRGLTLTVTADPDRWNFWTVFTPLSTNNIPQTLWGLLGDKQMKMIHDAHPDLTGPEARALYSHISAQLGFNRGN
ncbi:hypothetical protein [Nocardia wallacei]|uniref:hypothetical protein n=1 Tax=Nocardia wallacei TaxID=480035 RepID=UPI002455A7E4|nr:hypothetical protein [Nocardia wallacei]